MEKQFSAAVEFYWAAREKQGDERTGRGGKDPGTRGAVVGGKQMDLLEQLVGELMERAGIPSPDIRRRSYLELPGYYRPEKKWDLVVVSKSTLVAAIELKSQAGPSFGNNFNNRTEEAIGSASDLWVAYREMRLGLSAIRPLLGYFFLLEDCPKVHLPVSASEPHFPVDPIFATASYCKRYEILLRRLVLERLYDTACLTLSTTNRPSRITHPSAELSFFPFALSIYESASKFAQLLR